MKARLGIWIRVKSVPDWQQPYLQSHPPTGGLMPIACCPGFDARCPLPSVCMGHLADDYLPTGQCMVSDAHWRSLVPGDCFPVLYPEFEGSVYLVPSARWRRFIWCSVPAGGDVAVAKM